MESPKSSRTSVLRDIARAALPSAARARLAARASSDLVHDERSARGPRGADVTMPVRMHPPLL
jgi:hypothetical protein